MPFTTVFGSLSKYEKGTMEIINDNPKYYVFSNVFEVASKSKPYEKIAVAKLVGAAKPIHIIVPTIAPRMALNGEKWLMTMAMMYEIRRPQMKAPRKSNGMAPPAPSFIFSSGIPISSIQSFLKSSEYQIPPSMKMATPPTRMAR